MTPLVFQLKGYYGPMTLAFKPLGRHPYAPHTITDEESRQLTQEEVQEWYEGHGWPARGRMASITRTRAYKGIFEIVG